MKTLLKTVVFGFTCLILFGHITVNRSLAGTLIEEADWTATFFPSADLSGVGIVVPAIDRINFEWGAGIPVVNGNAVPGIFGRPYSVRFTSTQYLPPGEYTSVITSFDGVRMFVNGEKLIDNFTLHSRTVDYTNYTVTSTPVRVVIEYFVSGPDATIICSCFYRSSELPPEIAAMITAAKNRPAFTDDRRNPDTSASAIVYCSGQDIHVYGVNNDSQGYLAFTLTKAELDEILTKWDARDGNVQLKSVDGTFGPISLWLLSSGQLQLHAAGLAPETYKSYDFIFEGCL